MSDYCVIYIITEEDKEIIVGISLNGFFYMSAFLLSLCVCPSFCLQSSSKIVFKNEKLALNNCVLVNQLYNNNTI